MDAPQFDALTKHLSSRRTAIGGLLAGLLLPFDAIARKQGNGKDKDKQRKRKDTKRTSAQAEPCWRDGACKVSKGSNVSQCDLEGYMAPDPLDCTRCNLSRANLRDADLTGVNFTRANLSGACLVDADFTGATFTNTTNLYNAIFCRTIMPNGDVNDSGCDAGTACCPTCAPQCTDKACGAPDGCGGLCQTGSCAAGLVCAEGLCIAGPGICPAGASICRDIDVDDCSETCYCHVTTEGQTACTDAFSLEGPGSNCGGCASSAECAALYPDVPGVVCVSGTACCDGGDRGYCVGPCPDAV